MRVLECSSRGDTRFSALYARLTIYGTTRTIEDWYQLSKRFGSVAPKTWRDAKGRKPTHIEVAGKQFPVDYLTAWYKLLWVGYFDTHPELLEYARTFDSFHDSFARSGCNNQATVIAELVRGGNQAVFSDPKVQTLRFAFVGR